MHCCTPIFLDRNNVGWLWLKFLALPASLFCFAAAGQCQTQNQTPAQSSKQAQPAVKAQAVAGKTEAKPGRGYLGVSLTEICPEVRAQTQLREGEGLIIGRIAIDSPAASLGLTHYDILTRFNDQWLMTPAQFATLVENAGAGTEVEITYLRRGAEHKVKATLGRKPDPVVPAATVPPTPEEMMTTVIRTLRDNPQQLAAVYRMLLGLNAAGADPSAAHGARVTLNDEAGVVELTIIGTSQEVRAWDQQGKLLFKGPCASAEQLEAMPEELRARVIRLQKECHLKPEPRRTAEDPEVVREKEAALEKNNPPR